MRRKTPGRQLQALVKRFGQKRVSSELSKLQKSLESNTGRTLTIICSGGLHAIPSRYLRGQVYEVIRGSLSMSNRSALRLQLVNLLRKLSIVLQSRAWQKIYLIPTGHSALAVQVKLLVFRITRIETVDVVYFGSGKYFDIEIDQRKILLAASK